MNNITIHGNVGQEVELKYSQSGMAIATFSVASTIGKDDKKKTSWFNVTVFSKLAENVAASVQKGDSVLVTGRMEQEEFTTKDGDKRKSTKLIADEVGISLRWNCYVKDQTEKTMAKVGQVFQTVPNLGDEEPF